MKVAIFCSANTHISAAYKIAGDEMGHFLGSHGHTLVFGGCNLGLMEITARATHEAGGRTIGVIPSIIEKSGRVSDYVDIEIPCDNLSDRKELMMAQCDIAIALPGGIGTLDEIFTMAASATIGYHHKPIYIYNINGFWDNLIRLLENLEKQEMIRGDWQNILHVATQISDIFPK